ncbi:hypothetical protein HN51_008225 [Arachis hypogaea]
MVHCFHLAGFPKGLINCVTGKGSEIGNFLIMHPASLVETPALQFQRRQWSWEEKMHAMYLRMLILILVP